MKVPFFDYPRLYIDDRSDLLRIFDEVGQRGAFIMQKDVDEFEESFRQFVGCNHTVAVANATDGLEISWMAANLQPGDEIICSAHTMLATASAIKIAGGIPVPVDIGDDGLICPNAVREGITPRTVGIMPTHLNGRTCNMDDLSKIVDEHNLMMVEDAAQALGSRFKGKHAGTFGHASAISFFPAKVLGCLGDGGGIIINDSSLYSRIYELHDHGRDAQGVVQSWGRNSRLDNLQAAILNWKLKTYPSVIERRREIASLYHTLLSSIEQLILPPPPSTTDDHFDVFQNYEIQAENRDLLKEYLSSKSIGTLIQWGGKALHQFEKLDFGTYQLPRTDLYFQKTIMLPMNMFISDTDVHYVAESIANFYQNCPA